MLRILGARISTSGAPVNRSFVRFVQVQKNYHAHTPLIDNLNLTIAEGEFFSLLGPSGSGKTTILMLLAGFESPTSGSIEFRGTPIESTPPNRRGFGVVFQHYALFPHMSVAQNVAFPLKARGETPSHIRQKVDHALGMVRMQALAGRSIDQLSGGQQQRVALARALVFSPDLVLMDEPLGALDKNLREEMQDEIKQLQQQLGLTVVYVTHDQDEAFRLSDRIAVLKEGCIQQVGTPHSIYETPNNAFVARFVGDCNIVTGKIESAITRMTPPFSYRVEVGRDQSIRAHSEHEWSIGTQVQLMIRPHNVHLAPTAAASDPNQWDNVHEVGIEAVTYGGDHIRIQAVLASKIKFFITLPTTGIDWTPVVGQTAQVAWQISHCRVLDTP